ncbi:hypothetical protein ACS5PK_22300 [Roseateles sp. DB2]|uniref:hypothetical protein n=1 Tax=Roseateles sp. DB2 TaxID=3453717 RepID=UPI003EEE51D3
MKPNDPTVAVLVALLSEAEHELFDERAAIREIEGGLSRTEAEAAALLDVLRLGGPEVLEAMAAQMRRRSHLI